MGSFQDEVRDRKTVRDKKTVIKTERKREADGLRDIHDRERERERERVGAGI